MKRCLFIICCFTCWFAHSQELNSSLSDTVVQVGKSITIYLRASLPLSAKVSFNPAVKNISAKSQKNNNNIIEKTNVALEIIKEFEYNIEEFDDKKIWTGKYVVLPWNIGELTIDKQKITIDNQEYLFDELKFNVSSHTIGEQDELFDIEEIFVDLPKKLSFREWISRKWPFLLGIALFFLVLVAFLRIKRTKKRESIAIMSLKERTLYAINALEEQKIWRENKLKLHYSELSYILRAYLSSRYDLNLLERTTQESCLLLQQMAIESHIVVAIADLLKQADLVKFSDFTFSESEIMHHLRVIRQIVAYTSPIEVPSLD